MLDAVTREAFTVQCRSIQNSADDLSEEEDEEEETAGTTSLFMAGSFQQDCGNDSVLETKQSSADLSVITQDAWPLCTDV